MGNKKTSAKKTVVFDLGVFTNHDFEEQFWRHEIPLLYANQHEIDLATAKENVFKEYDDKKGKVGANWVDLNWWFKQFDFYKTFGENILKEKIEEHESKISFYDDSLQVLDMMKSDFINLVLCTNSTRLFLDKRFKYGDFNIFNGLLDKVYSCPDDYKTLRKDQRILNCVCRDLNINPNSLLLINASHDNDTHNGKYKLDQNNNIPTLKIDRGNKSDNNSLTSLYPIISQGLTDLIELREDNKLSSKKLFFLCDMNFDTWPSWIKLVNEAGDKPKDGLERNVAFKVYDPLFQKQINQKYQRRFGNVYLHERCTLEQIKETYDMIASDYDKDYPENRALNAFIISRLEANLPLKEASIMDLGAGTGTSSEELVKLGYDNVTLMDISEKMLEKAKEKESLKDKKYLIGDFKTKIEKKYDAIVSINSLHYSENDSIDEILSNLGNNLNETGIIAIVTPRNEICHIANKYFEFIEVDTYTHTDMDNSYDIPYFIGRKKHVE